ncbi:MAG: beta-lactamase family protein [Myxococcales bacterium]|nr:beta-lactamase family protein [Myxococcales bacterium]
MSAALRIEHLIRAAVADGVAPAIAFAVAAGEEPPRRFFAGHHRPGAGEPCGPGTIFDLASLTKPLCTTLWALRLIDAGHLALDDRIGDRTACSDPRLADSPLWRLLTHTAGLPSHGEYHRGLGPVVRRTGRFDDARRAVRRMLTATESVAAPGERELYSDVGYLLLEAICEAVDRPLAAVWPTLPGHGPAALHFRPLTAPDPAPDPGCAATEQCPWRGRMLQGEVHDDNTWTIGGVAGQAGLFGTLDAVLTAGRAWLAALRGRPSPLGVSPELARLAIHRRWMHPRGTRVLGWDTPTPGRSSAGRHFGPHAIGHLGFTGTSLWIDPEAEVVMVLLTNRVCPTRARTAIQPLRPALHDAGWALLWSRFT